VATLLTDPNLVQYNRVNRVNRVNGVNGVNRVNRVLLWPAMVSCDLLVTAAGPGGVSLLFY
jgi:hypothetical protein